MSDIIGGNYGGEDIAGSKRTAMAGQWQTPPVLCYPSSSSQPQLHVPDSSAEYAQALQEAYRKGAEAASRMAQQQQIPTAASCPNFSTGVGFSQSATRVDFTSVEEESAETINLERKVHTSLHHPPPPHHHHQNEAMMSNTDMMSVVPPNTLSSSMPPPPPPSARVHPNTQQHQSLVSMHHSSQHTNDLPNPHFGVAPSPSYLETTMTSNSNDNKTSTILASRPLAETIKQVPGRSLSMPDMTTYTAEAEEEKRLKRLARNRASARLRRLRKKNLVDAYETEVGILEKTLKQLKAHEWGNTDDHKALLDALGMERGQQELTPEQRTMMIQDILKQQMQQIEILQEAQREQEFLSLLASHEENETGNNDDDNEIFRELENILNLSTEQKQRIRDSSEGLQKEVEALDTICASLHAVQENEWLVNEGVQKITDQFSSILHKNQQSKLLLWADSNSEAIDQLDYLQVQPLQSAPIFSFGDDE